MGIDTLTDDQGYLDSRNWASAEIHAAPIPCPLSGDEPDPTKGYIAPPGFYSANYFVSQDALRKFARLRGRFDDELIVETVPPTEESVGCTLFGRRRLSDSKIIFFAYEEGGQDYIYARQPRIEKDANAVRLLSGNTARLMHQAQF